MTVDPQIHRDLGDLQARVKLLERQIEGMEKKIDTLLEAVTEARGGFRLVLTVGAFGASVAVILSKLWERLT